MQKYYDFLREQYPENISLQQFYQIGHISKRKAKWLLDNKVVPCRDSGKKTRRYTIVLEDVILYLQKCSALGLSDLAPNGIFSSKPQIRAKKIDEFQELYTYLELPEHQEQLRQYYNIKLKSYQDALITLDVVQITGFSKSIVNEWIKKQHFKAFRGKTNRIPKQYLIDFLCSGYYVRIRRRSDKQRADMLGFLELISTQ
ncbi:DNA-binding protein [Anaerotignum sp.]|uniref:DNA-binding protein n=1 Tax=Anaerotignum sp. TaxID=2039241 RepID=UPI0028A92260|nr:DNA-binding protein [Anaerotignum sp.]